MNRYSFRGSYSVIVIVASIFLWGQLFLAQIISCKSTPLLAEFHRQRRHRVRNKNDPAPSVCKMAGKHDCIFIYQTLKILPESYFYSIRPRVNVISTSDGTMRCGASAVSVDTNVSVAETDFSFDAFGFKAFHNW